MLGPLAPLPLTGLEPFLPAGRGPLILMLGGLAMLVCVFAWQLAFRPRTSRRGPPAVPRAVSVPPSPRPPALSAEDLGMSAQLTEQLGPVRLIPQGGGRYTLGLHANAACGAGPGPEACAQTEGAIDRRLAEVAPHLGVAASACGPSASAVCRFELGPRGVR